MTIPFGSAVGLGGLKSLKDTFLSTEKMPVLFIGHGSPMNGILDNSFSRGWADMARQLSVPQAVVVVSAHWESRGTFITAMDTPRTIHDFGGFPQGLYQVQYPAPGNPQLASQMAGMIIRYNCLDEDECLISLTRQILERKLKKNSKGQIRANYPMRYRK